jgi:hypothetical protein
MGAKEIPLDLLQALTLAPQYPSGLAWAVKGKRRIVGGMAGSKTRFGYWCVRLGDAPGKLYQAHRIVWTIANGKSPQGFIDHIDRNRGNNAIENLRLATRTENNQNRIFQGYGIHAPGIYRARIRVNGRLAHLGLFKTIEESKAAYIEACNRLRGGFSPYLEAE